MKSRWQQIFRQVYLRILTRQVPHAILSWRYFIPNQSMMVNRHKRVLFNAWTKLPRSVWWLIALYSYSVWYLFNSWRQIARVWKNRSLELYHHNGISRVKQLMHLTVLAIGHTIPPHFYYLYRLYDYKENQWLDFIYTHELPHWHQMMSPNISMRSQHLMSDKVDFAHAMTAVGLPLITTLYARSKGEKITEQQLFNQKSMFLKPIHGSQKKGALALIYRAQSDCYDLTGDGAEHLGNVDSNNHRSGIVNFIQQKINQEAYLFQPLLKNDTELSTIFSCKELITVRLITALNNENTLQAISAVLEIPNDGRYNQVHNLAIEITAGRLIKPSDDFDTELLAKYRLGSELKIPNWQHVVDISINAHKSFLDIYAIGWDLTITAAGIKLIEGNINWGLVAHQVNTPLIIK